MTTPEPLDPMRGEVPGPEASPRPQPTVYPWYHKMWSFVFITFCAEVGLFLLIFPWTDAWENNFFSNLIAVLEPVWNNMYFRGAISGLGVVNLYISIAEIIRLRRFARR